MVGLLLGGGALGVAVVSYAGDAGNPPEAGKPPDGGKPPPPPGLGGMGKPANGLLPAPAPASKQKVTSHLRSVSPKPHENLRASKPASHGNLLASAAANRCCTGAASC